MEKYQNVITDVAGNSLNLATVTVVSYPSNGAVTIYSDDGVTAVPNSVVTTNSKGEYFFYAPTGRYNLQIRVNGALVNTILDVQIDSVKYRADLASSATGLGSALVTFQPAGTGAVARTLQSKERDIISVKDFGAIGNGTTLDTTAENAAIAAAVVAGAALYYPSGTYFTGRLTSVSGKLTVYGESKETTSIKIDYVGAYTGDTSPILAVTGSSDIEFKNITIDQNWTNFNYPAGMTYDDSNRASTWGGGSWVFDLATTGKVTFDNCQWLNIFRGVIIKNANSSYFRNNRSDSLASLGQCIISSQDCGTVIYDGNHLIGRDFQTTAGAGTAAAGLHGNSCNNVQITHNYTLGHQMVFMGSPNGSGLSSDRLVVSGNVFDTPIADTAFYRWRVLTITNNVVRRSGDMGIAVSSSDYLTITGNAIDGTHIGGIALTDCFSGVVSSNIIKDIAQVYANRNAISPLYGSNAGTFLSGVVTDYQSGGAQSKGLCITANSLWFENLPPVTDALGNVRINVKGILFDTSANTAAQNTGTVTGNYLYPNEPVNMPQFIVHVPTHRFYLAAASRTGVPVYAETFTSGGNSFRLIADYGDGNLLFLDRLIGTIPDSTAFVGATSGATLVSAALPQLTFLQCVAENNFDSTTVYRNIYAPISGSFTPTIEGSTSAGAGTYTAQIGRYTKFWDVVIVWIKLAWTAHTGTGNLLVANNPFTSANIMAYPVSFNNNAMAGIASEVIQGQVRQNSTKIDFTTYNQTTGAITALAIDGAVTELLITATYRI